MTNRKRSAPKATAAIIENSEPLELPATLEELENAAALSKKITGDDDFQKVLNIRMLETSPRN